MNGLGVRLVQAAYVVLVIWLEVQFHLWSRAVMGFVQGDDTARLHRLLGFGLALVVGWAVRRAL